MVDGSIFAHASNAVTVNDHNVVVCGTLGPSWGDFKTWHQITGVENAGLSDSDQR